MDLKNYLWTEFKFNVAPKYYKYFDEWYNNITDTQKIYFEAYNRGDKTPYASLV